MEKIEQPPITNKEIVPEEKWEQKVKERAKLWESVIRDSLLDDSIKERFLQLIRERKSMKYGKDFNSIGDWVYFTLNQLLILTEQAEKEGMPKKTVTRPLFENLKADLWAFAEKMDKEMELDLQ